MEHYDSLIIGAGHNGLVCAAYLARAGQRVLVLEASEGPGGLAADREFHPGFHASIAHSVGHFSERVAKDLDLKRHGLDLAHPLSLIGLRQDAGPVVIRGDSVQGADAEDANAYQRLHHQLQRFADHLSPFWLKTMPRLSARDLSSVMTFGHMGWNLRRLGRDDLREFLRVASLPARDLMDENFSDNTLKAALSWDGLIGAKMAPRSPNSAILSMLYRRSGKQHGGHAVPSGGSAGLARALEAAAKSHGATIRYNAPVEQILIDGNEQGLTAQGVRLAEEELQADQVISGIDPKRTFFELVGVEHLEIGFTNRIHRLRSDGYVAKLHLALDGLPSFNGLDAPDGRMIIAPSLDALEFAYDDAKHGGCPDEPVMEITIPSLHEPGLAPDGQHVLSAHVMYVPYRLKGGWTALQRDATRDRAIEVISRYAPGIWDQILHAEFLTPQDIERDYRVSGGHWHHGEFAMDQMLMMRPTYGAAQYATPVTGLYLCGAGSHPAGDLTGAPGHNAAQRILKEGGR